VSVPRAYKLGPWFPVMSAAMENSITIQNNDHDRLQYHPRQYTTFQQVFPAVGQVQVCIFQGSYRDLRCPRPVQGSSMFHMSVALNSSQTTQILNVLENHFFDNCTTKMAT
jgi:hypothetical protein